VTRLLTALLLVVSARAAAAQDVGLRRHHLNVNVGVATSGGYDVGVAAAELRGNGPGALPPPFPYFLAESRMKRATTHEVRIGFAVTRRIAVEGAAALGNARIGVAISGDAEAPAQDLFGEDVKQYLFEGGVSWQLPMTVGRVAPFVSAGGGFLRQLHEERTLAETGQLYYAGGGARYWLMGGGRSSMALGLRGDVRLNVRHRGIDFENKLRTYPSLALALFLGL